MRATPIRRGALRALAVFALLPGGHALTAQDVRPPLDFSRPVTPDTTPAGRIPDAVLREALDRYNGAATRIAGAFISTEAIGGSLGVYRGPVRLEGHVSGEVVVINGDLRLTSTARIDGRVTVIGGRLIVDRGATLGDTVVYLQPAPVGRDPDGTLQPRHNGRSLGDYAAISFSTGRFDAGIRASLGHYNRVEELPLRLSPSLTWHADSNRSLRLEFTGIARTATPQEEKRSAFGWNGSLTASTRAPWPVSIGVEAGNMILSMNDQPFPETDPGLSALLYRRDYRDWYSSRYWGMFARWSPAPSLTLGGSLRFSREASIRAVDAFSLFRSQEPWRANPLIDDGRYVTASVTGTFDTRDHPRMPSSGWYVRGELRRTMSHAITPVSLPVTIRDELNGADYGADELNFDARFYHRLNPTQAVHLRLAGGGYLGGDPLTLQHRRAVGGSEPLGGYLFRALNCDRRRRRDPVAPALCDREMVAQVEFRQSLRLDLSTRISGYTVGFQQPDLVFFADAGSAWLAGDGPGKVPTGRIQTISEWRSSIGIGLDGGAYGLYLTKAIADPEPFRLRLRINGPRF